MKSKTFLYTAILTLLIGLALLTGIPFVASDPLAQGNPTEQQQTIDAIVAERFNKTATAQGSISVTQTIDAAFNQAVTSTVAFQSTLQTAFNEALTATATLLPVVREGSIGFVARVDGRSQIYQINIDGTNLRNLSNSNTDDGAYGITLSPNGELIAYTSAPNQDSEDVQLWVMNADGSNKRQLTYRGLNITPSWSPSSDQIVFASVPNRNDRSQISIMNSDGSNVRQLTSGSENKWAPVWSPAGDKIAYQIRRENAIQIQVIDLATNTVLDIDTSTSGAIFPFWNTDGTSLRFVVSADFWICDSNNPVEANPNYVSGGSYICEMDVNTMLARRVSDTFEFANGGFFPSYNSRYIAVNFRGILLVDINGSNPTVIPNTEQFNIGGRLSFSRIMFWSSETI